MFLQGCQVSPVQCMARMAALSYSIPCDNALRASTRQRHLLCSRHALWPVQSQTSGCGGAGPGHCSVLLFSSRVMLSGWIQQWKEPHVNARSLTASLQPSLHPGRSGWTCPIALPSVLGIVHLRRGVGRAASRQMAEGRNSCSLMDLRSSVYLSQI